jgi:hypothetical protein
MTADHDAERRVSGKPIALVLAAVLVGAALFKWWPSEDRAIRRQLDALADTLTVPSTDSELALAARLGELRTHFSPDVRVRLGGQTVASRDALLALAARWKPSPGGVFVAFTDTIVELGGDGAADVYSTARVSERDARSGQPVVEEHETRIGFAKREGRWVITSVEPLEGVPPSPKSR